MLHTRQKGLSSLSFAQQITGIVIMIYNDNEPASFVKGKQIDEGGWGGGSDSE